MSVPPIRVCFVCLGNICRSPTAEGVMKHLIETEGLTNSFFIDSAGTGAYHVGEAADARSAEAALRQGITLTSVARQFIDEDFEQFDYIVAMDRKNYAHLQRLARREADRAKISLLRSFDPHADGLDVPDPYFEDNFDVVFDICRAGCTGLIAKIIRDHGLVREA
ncbi:MAG: low molecular weight protein-tyrosine-phosphatase [Polyangiales bacterium]